MSNSFGVDIPAGISVVILICGESEVTAFGGVSPGAHAVSKMPKPRMVIAGNIFIFFLIY